MIRKLLTVLEMIKFQHSIFALPFALASALHAANGIPPFPVLGWIVLAMVSARSAAMAWNRLVDLRFDAENPRTAGRALPRGLVGRAWVAGFTGISCAVFGIFAAKNSISWPTSIRKPT
jgi:4-hydroxybenzoate polyprenyltransferase